MLNKTKMVVAAMLVLGIASASQAGSKDAQATYDYARSVFGYIEGPYPFEYTPDLRYRGPLRSGDLCWANTGNGNLGWVPCR